MVQGKFACASPGIVLVPDIMMTCDAATISNLHAALHYTDSMFGIVFQLVHFSAAILHAVLSAGVFLLYSWEYFPHDDARARAYRWGEDGLLGLSDERCQICFSLSFWNGRDPIIKVKHIRQYHK